MSLSCILTLYTTPDDAWPGVQEKAHCHPSEGLCWPNLYYQIGVMRGASMFLAAYAIWRKEQWTFSLCFYIAGAIWGAGGIVKGLSESG